MINKVILVGRAGNDPEIINTQKGSKIATLNLATSEKYKNKEGKKIEVTDWHKIVAYNKLAEIIDNYVKKGDLLYIEGELKTNSYEKNGEKRYTTSINCYGLRMLGGKKEFLNESNDDIPF